MNEPTSAAYACRPESGIAIAADGITLCCMMTMSLKLPESLLREIEREAAARGVSKSAVIRDSLDRTLRKGRKAEKTISCLDLMGDLVGHFDGPQDLSTNKKHLAQAITAHHEGGRAAWDCVGHLLPPIP
jgi:Arc/MetJ-type ribon-helix-helix transcriptional regulator